MAKRYRVEEVEVNNPNPPPEVSKKFAIYDRRASSYINAFFDSREQAEVECSTLNELSPGPY